MNPRSYLITEEHPGFTIEYNSGTCSLNSNVIIMRNVDSFRIKNTDGLELLLTINNYSYNTLNDILSGFKNILEVAVQKVAILNEQGSIEIEEHVSIDSVTFLEPDSASYCENDGAALVGDDIDKENWQWLFGVDLLTADSVMKDRSLSLANIKDDSSSSKEDHSFSVSNIKVDLDLVVVPNYNKVKLKWIVGIIFFTVTGILLKGGGSNIFLIPLLGTFSALSVLSPLAIGGGAIIIGFFAVGAMLFLKRVYNVFSHSSFMQKNALKRTSNSVRSSTTASLVSNLQARLKMKKSSNAVEPISFPPGGITCEKDSYKWIIKINVADPDVPPSPELKSERKIPKKLCLDADSSKGCNKKVKPSITHSTSGYRR